MRSRRPEAWFARLAIAILLCLPNVALAQDGDFASKVNALSGYWLARQESESPPRAFGFRVANVLSVDRGSASLVLYFGDVSRRWEEARDARADASGNGAGVTLSFLVPGSPAVRLERQQDGSFSGDVAAGGIRKLRFEKTTLPDLQRWIAEHPAPQVQARRNSVIELVNLSATDCPYCVTWERDYIERGRLTRSEIWPQIRYTMQKRARLRDAVRAADLPEHLRPAVLQAVKHRGRDLTGAPWFVVTVDGRMRGYLFGTESFDAYIGATLRAAIRERESDVPQSSQ